MSLFGEERKQIILQLVNANGKVRTNELVEKLQVSSESIRRYLEELEMEKKLKRVYGGAVKLNLDRSEPSHMSREVMRAEEKKRIGRAAAEMVQDNDTIVIDEGTTPLQMINYLSTKKDLTILTSSITALNMLIEHQNGGLLSAEIYFLGGKVNAKHHRVGGSFAEDMMKDFFVDKAFLSVDGLLISKGITCYDPERAVLARRFIENANESIIMADHSKIGTSTLCKVAELKDIDIVISDTTPPDDWNKELHAHNVTWLVAE
ncbi:DeoR/GlpR family DNA-binding transcription regulator [Brevibacillus choshinensis]|uniref:DeoR/GlpR family DNA-binding transcription regulator n=1 Tax=Brevibacillus choshinensis TaxID=54911 RepID=UPI002E1F6653|nr:DeoR/GlpR family DNA-binding transcription regulator [Brevibacillus choshinensis]MED4752828.1 DeoR/GlpR family DNA-binding transcription regulator [Brevibacillus choshinensis]MED4781595.1 DeoR/GlpR family DNA-binding transcription regulator [Brevibacillus choshinensis]